MTPRRRRRADRNTPTPDAFWGLVPGSVPDADSDAGDDVEPPIRIRATPEPGAVPRSLGDPPLAASTAALEHLAVVYEEAVRTAVALAAANGLLEQPDDD